MESAESSVLFLYHYAVRRVNERGIKSSQSSPEELLGYMRVFHKRVQFQWYTAACKLGEMWCSYLYERPTLTNARARVLMRLSQIDAAREHRWIFQLPPPSYASCLVGVHHGYLYELTISTARRQQERQDYSSPSPTRKVNVALS